MWPKADADRDHFGVGCFLLTFGSCVSSPAALIAIWKNIGALRGIAILFAVANHAAVFASSIRTQAIPMLGPFSTVEKALVIPWLTIAEASIGGFMIASGYLMGRFFASWPATKGAVQGLLVRYVAWSIPMFAVRALMNRGLSLELIKQSFIDNFGPFPAYWFFVSLMLFSLLNPWVSRWSKQRPWQVLGLFLVTELIRVGSFYAGYNAPWYAVPLRGTYFFLGSVLAQHSTVFTEKVGPHRRLLFVLMLLTGAGALYEGIYWWNADGGMAGHILSKERASIRIFSVTFSAWALLRESKPSRWMEVLNNIGLKSMAIFLLFDCVINATMSVVRRISSPFHLPTIREGGMPLWAARAEMTVFYWAVAVTLPLLLAYLVDRFGGPRWKKLLFG